MYKYALIAATLCGLLPLAADAAVRVNEIAWMGTDLGGANCEWIELYNPDPAVVDLSNWSIVITNTGSATPKTINLGEDASVKYTGIAGNGFYVVARSTGSCASLAPGLTADWVGSFGSGISNNGAKIELFNGIEMIDSVSSLSGWTVAEGKGGKNDSGKAKETPQYSGGAWITAPPTPRSLNASAPVETIPEEEEPDPTAPVVTVGGTTPTTPAASPLIKLYLDPGPDRIVSVGADTPYTATVYDGTGKLRPDADVSWNFGDGGRKSGRSVTYAYREAGEYHMTVRAETKDRSTIAMLSIVASPAEVAIAEVSDRGIVLANGSDRMLDLSSWRLKAGKKKFVLPEDTVIPPGTTVFLPAVVTALPTSSLPTLLFPNGMLAAAYEMQPMVAGASIEKVQEVVPVPKASVIVPSYAEDPYAPVAVADAPVAGAALPQTGNVFLKGEYTPSLWGIGPLFEGILASVASFIVR